MGEAFLQKGFPHKNINLYISIVIKMLLFTLFKSCKLLELYEEFAERISSSEH